VSIERIERKVIACTRCPELRTYCGAIAREKKRAYADHEYWGKPVPALGDPNARVVLVGLAPGAHGSNRTGRMFTGDASGNFLFPALYRAGFASQPTATDRDDGMELRDCFITAAARCAPPQNKPTPQELRNCYPYLLEEFDAMPRIQVLIGLGKIGFDAAARVLRDRNYTFKNKPIFGHGALFTATDEARRTIALLGTFHPSQQNTNTGKLTVPMFDAIFKKAKSLLQ
jgi:uracil-DNA glycosylase family 4